MGREEEGGEGDVGERSEGVGSVDTPPTGLVGLPVLVFDVDCCFLLFLLSPRSFLAAFLR